jgi:hypothetical protein
MRFELDLPWGPYTLAYGLDLCAGPEPDWFGELVGDDDVITSRYDLQSHGYDHDRPLQGLIKWLAQTSGLFDEADVEEVLERLIIEDAKDVRLELRPLAEIIVNLKVAADHA